MICDNGNGKTGFACMARAMSRFVWPSMMSEMLGEGQSNQDNRETVSLIVLAGLAKAGDTSDQIKANIITARAYAEEVEKQWELMRAEDAKNAKITSLERYIQDQTEVSARLTGNLDVQKSAVDELERIAKATLGENIEKPKTKRGQEIIVDLTYAKSLLKNFESQLDDVQKSLVSAKEELRGLKGEPEPVPAAG